MILLREYQTSIELEAASASQACDEAEKMAKRGELDGTLSLADSAAEVASVATPVETSPEGIR